MEQTIKPVNVLVIDDDLGVRESLKIILTNKYDVFTSAHVEEAVQVLKDKDTEPAVILLDIRMPNANGLEFIKHIHSLNPAIPVIVITAFPSSQTAIAALRKGAFDYIIKPFQPLEILASIERALQHRFELTERDTLLYNLRRAIKQNFFSTTEALLLAIDAKDAYTAGHSKRVSNLFAFVAKELNMNKSKVEVLRYGAFLHDIGKIGISDIVLMKPNYFTKEEFHIMKRHSEIGYRILEPIDFLKESLPMVRHHHEWYNGNGYPDGLKKGEIPYEAAILSVVDAYDALTSDRHYHKKYTHQKALDIIVNGIGTQFDKKLTGKVLVIIDKYYKVNNKKNDLIEELCH